MLYPVLWVSGYWQALMLLMDVPGFLLGHRESGHLYFSEEHFQIRMWRKELKLQRLVWKLKNLLFMSLGTMHSLFSALWCAGRVLSKPPLLRWKLWHTACLLLAQILPKSKKREHIQRRVPHTKLLPVSGEHEEEFKGRIWGTLLIQPLCFLFTPLL